MENVTALAREISPSMEDCELSFLARSPIDVERARAQHRAYLSCLTELGARVVALPAEPYLPDAVFVEDTAVVVDEVAVVTRPGAVSRRPEVISVAESLMRYRSVEFMDEPATLDGGDVMHVGRTLYVGRTARTNADGIEALRRALAPHGYAVRAVSVDGCLHYKSGCSYVGQNTVLANPAWVDTGEVEGLEVIHVDPDEPWAANTVRLGGTVLVSAAAPATRARLEARGFRTRALDIGEIEKAEGGLSCMSILIGGGLYD